MKPKFTQEVKALLGGDGELALTSSTWSVSGNDADGKAFTANGKSMEVVRRQPDGTWRFVIDNPHGRE
jgi:ketosteroid isomerase-like protein